MPRFTPAASATSRTDRPAQPRLGKSSRPAAMRARSRLREGRGGMDVTIRAYSYDVKPYNRAMSAAPSAAAGGDPEEAFRHACELEAQGRLDEALAAFLALRARLPSANAPLEMQLASVHL